MLPDTNPDPEIDLGVTDVDPSPTEAAVPSGDTGVEKVEPDEGGGGGQGNPDLLHPEGNDGPDAGDTEGVRGEPHSEGEAQARPRRRTGSHRSIITASEIAAALKLSGGDRERAAATLNMNQAALNMRVANTPELRVVWGVTAESRAALPTEKQSRMRKPKDLQEINVDITPGQIELANVVSESDNLLLRKKLKEYGLSDQSMKRLKMLDELAPSSGHFLSMSLDKTHRNYFLQLLQMSELAEQLFNNIKDGKYQGEELAFMLKAYTDMVKEGGKGFQHMREGAEAIFSMMKGAQRDPEAGGGKNKPGFSVLGKGKKR